MAVLYRYHFSIASSGGSALGGCGLFQPSLCGAHGLHMDWFVLPRLPRARDPRGLYWGALSTTLRSSLTSVMCALSMTRYRIAVHSEFSRLDVMHVLWRKKAAFQKTL